MGIMISIGKSVSELTIVKTITVFTTDYYSIFYR